jgi:nucleoside-diphosphate-sugar epimerase
MNLTTLYEGKTVVITGASGYIAGALLEVLKHSASRIVRVSRLPLPPLGGSAACTDLTGDYSDPGLWHSAIPGADTLFHLASQTSFYMAAKDPEADFRANVAPMRAILGTCWKDGHRPFIVFAGSATQVGLPGRLPVDESLLDQPVTIYDIHKLAAEILLEGYARQGFARGTTLRLTNVYGPGTRSSSADRGVLNAMIARALHGEALAVYGDGQPIRDYIYIADVVTAFLAAGRGRPTLNARHFVIGTGRGISLENAFRLVTERVAAKGGAKVPVNFVPEPSGQSVIESRRFVADISAFRSAAGWVPSVSLEEGIDRTIDHMRAAKSTQGFA